MKKKVGKVEMLRLPSGFGGAALVSFPLPKCHWLYKEGLNEPPMPFRAGTSNPVRRRWERNIRKAGKYAIRAATRNGRDKDFDPDALLQNLVVGMLGYHTPDGRLNLDHP